MELCNFRPAVSESCFSRFNLSPQLLSAQETRGRMHFSATTWKRNLISDSKSLFHKHLICSPPLRALVGK